MLTITLRQVVDAGPCYDPVARNGLEKASGPNGLLGFLDGLL